jgi:CheY-like chemotaxis protein
MRIFFLDDEETRHQRFAQKSIGHVVVHSYTAAAAIRTLQQEKPFDVVCLDHDLSDAHVEAYLQGGAVPEEETGAEVARFIAEHPEVRPQMVVCHSFNEPGRRRMGAILRDAGVRVVLMPFGSWWPPSPER